MSPFSYRKYKSKRVVVDGYKFDSKAEAEFYLSIKFDSSIKILEMQPKVYLTKSKILYKPDFKIEQDGKVFFVDVKGYPTAVFNLKKRLWKNYGAGELRILSKKGKSFTVSEIILTQ